MGIGNAGNEYSKPAYLQKQTGTYPRSARDLYFLVRSFQFIMKFRNFSNFRRGRIFVNKSAGFSFVSMYTSSIIFSGPRWQ